MSKVRLVVYIPERIRERINKESDDRDLTLSEYAREVFQAQFEAQDRATPASKGGRKR